MRDAGNEVASELPCELKTLYVALNIAGGEKYSLKTCGCGQPIGHLSRVLNEGSISDHGGRLLGLFLPFLQKIRVLDI